MCFVINRSNTLDIILFIEIGLYFSLLDGSPFLKIGVIKLYFHFIGHEPFLIDLLNIIDNGK